MTAISTGDSISPLALARNIGSLIRDMSSDNVVKYSAPTRLDSLCVVDSQAAALPYIDTIQTNLNNIVAAYYLQALSIATVADAKVMGNLNKLNPNRDMIDATSGSRYFSPNFDMLSASDNKAFNIGFGGSRLSMLDDREFEMDAPYITGQNNINLTNNRKMMEAQNLSMGKLIDITVHVDGADYTFPLNVRLLANIVQTDQLVDLLATGIHNKNIKERFHMVKSGQIEFWRDFIMCQDEIEEHRRRLIEDKTGLYAQRHRAKNSNRIAAILSGRPSVAQASAIQVITEDTAKEIEMKGKFRFDRFAQREKYLDTNLAMITAIVSPSWKQVTFYYKSISEPSIVSVKELENLKAKEGPDVLSILNSLRDSAAPTF